MNRNIFRRKIIPVGNLLWKFRIVYRQKGTDTEVTKASKKSKGSAPRGSNGLINGMPQRA